MFLADSNTRGGPRDRSVLVNLPASTALMLAAGLLTALSLHDLRGTGVAGSASAPVAVPDAAAASPGIGVPDAAARFAGRDMPAEAPAPAF
jgi:hypothetical protein